MKKPRLIIVEGSQGVGKGTITNILREQMTYTNLLRLSGIEGKDLVTREKVYSLRSSELVLIESTRYYGINYVLDRSFMTERVYCKLGYKEYDFAKEADCLLEYLNYVGEYYDIQYIVLTANEGDYKERLKRNKPIFNDVVFDVERSIRQQETYVGLIPHMKSLCPNIRTYVVNTSGREPQDIAYDIIHSLY